MGLSALSLQVMAADGTAEAAAAYFLTSVRGMMCIPYKVGNQSYKYMERFAG